uniref:CCHC-type domain-containing protein n=1 Tax=Trichobilharzia regenti TaxID=157069 RepID=A0AA85IVE1_TRIRE|nr:unnamed protein product [Trichobilharzia regenti]
MELSNLGKFPLNGSPREIADYLECFDAWCISKNVRDDKIPAHFITAIGLDAYSLVKNLAFPDKPISMPYAKLRELLIDHFHVTTFETRERAQFNKLVRSPNQKIRDFILQLQIQASKCNFGDQLHTQLRDRLIAGINIPKLEKELIQIPSCTFQTAKDVCITYEDVHNEYSAPTTSVSDVMLSKVENTSGHGKQSKLPSTGNRMQREIKNIKPCLSCGKLHLRSTCRFRGAKCYKCGKVGHIKTVCRSSNTYVAQHSYNSPKLSSKMESMCLSTFQNTQANPMKTSTTSSATQASTVFKNEVAELQCELSKARKDLNEMREQLIKIEELLHMHRLRLSNAEHTSTRESPAKRFKSRILKKHLMSTTSNVHYYKGNNYRPSVGIILQKMGNRVVKILDIKDHSVHNGHLDKVTINEVGRSNYNIIDSANNPDFVDNSEISPDNTDENNITESVRSKLLASKPRHRYKYARRYSRCGGCGD